MKRRRNASWPKRLGPWKHFSTGSSTAGIYDWTGDSGGYDSVEVGADIYKSNEGEQEIGQGGDRVVWAVEYTVAVPSGYAWVQGEWTQVYSSKPKALADLPETFGALRARATEHAGETVDMRLKRNSETRDALRYKRRLR
jgi:hypothetical protein